MTLAAQFGPVCEEIVQHRLRDTPGDGRFDTDHRGRPRFGDQDGQLTDRAAGALLERHATSALDTDPTIDDGEQVVLDDTFGDDHIAGQQRR